MRPLVLILWCSAIPSLDLTVSVAGAQQHWAFTKPRATALPAVKDSSWSRDSLDRFVLSGLEARQLRPTREANRARYIRRVSLDLTGLPPTPAEVSAFTADQSPDAYEKLVDRLLASPRYGERMASDWLDVARYADTYGYQSDVDRRVWPWRDWVIKSFNANQPYDEFATWQLAGDLLPNASREQRIATTFNRLHRQTNEGGSVEEEYRVEYVADRVHTFGMAFLGLSFECARCHDHKFDPISQREYYSLTAYFDDIDESGLYSHFTRGVPTPALLLTNSEQEQRLADLTAKIDRVAEQLQDSGGTRLIGHFTFDQLEKGKLPNEVGEKAGRVHDNPVLHPGRLGKALQFSGENNASFPGVGEFRRWDPFSFGIWIRVAKHTDRAVIMHRSKAWTDAASCGYQLLLEDGRPSFSLIHFWPGDAIRVRVIDAVPSGEWVHIGITYDGSSKAAGLRLFIDGEAAKVDVIRDHLTKDIVSGGRLALTLAQRFRDKGFVRGSVDDLQVYAGVLSPAEIHELAQGQTLTLQAVSAASEKQHDELKALRRERATLIDKIPAIMTMAATAKPRDAFLLARGSYTDRRDRVDPAVPAILGNSRLGMPQNRLELAAWLTHPDHPLTARVAVNRLWQMVFGQGLVATTEDFGRQGSPPSLPRLLDHLALEFVQSGWDLKAMLRRMVLSATYRQDSLVSAEQRAADPEAIFLSRYPSRRLTAEAIRDTGLFASGLLIEKRGGASVKPYQPAGLWKEKSGRTYKHDKGDGLYRRSLYTFWKRTSPPPSMMIFDSGKREVCIARRHTTNTPLQALVLLNDPQFVESSRMLAERVMHEVSSTRDRLIRIFLHLTAQEPNREQVDVMLDLHRQQLADYANDADAALALLGVGDHPRDKSLSVTEVATLTIVASTVFSFDSVVMQR